MSASVVIDTTVLAMLTIRTARREAATRGLRRNKPIAAMPPVNTAEIVYQPR